jgi:hypothetical protein
MEARRRQRQSDTKPSETRHQVIHPIPPSRQRATSIDSLLVRITQLIVVIGLLWFVYLIASVNNVISSSAGGGTIRRVPTTTSTSDLLNVHPAKQQIESIRMEFYNRYGGKDEATAMLKRGLQTFSKSSSSPNNQEAFSSDSLRGTAVRLLSLLIQQQQHNPQQPAQFIFSFGGYSVTVGRGNHFTQSFPFVFQSITKPLLSSIGIELQVRNSAIGGIPSFPYGWCLPNFLGKDSHGISWDYGMNEGNGGMGLEGYLRHGLSSMEDHSPMFVMVDTKKSRKDILQYYVDKGYLIDPLALGRANDALNKKMLNLPEDRRPIGLRGWDEWGAPKGSPGQSPWHPKKMEHELMGWMLAMYFVESVEVALGIMESGEDWRESVMQDEMYGSVSKGKLPPPMTDGSGTGVSSLLHGVASQESNDEWTMPQVSCRTSFLPNISGHLESIVVSGLTKDDEDMIKPRDDALFDGGWVMDVGKVERETKEKVNKYGGLGYIDMKTALYGIPSSGTLKLWLPHEGSTDATNGNNAADCYKSVVLCEVNEKRGSKECNMLSDLEFRVGGATVSKENVHQINQVASYLKKDICIHVDIPNAAKVSSKDGSIGLDVEVTVVNEEVSRENGACSISHVIWQHQ